MTFIKKLKPALLILLLFCACKKPTDNLKLVIDTDLIKYTSLIHITDADNPDQVIQNATLSISGRDAANIYEISGKKHFTVQNGIITIGVGPAQTPTANNPATCTIQVSSPGYNPVTYTITYHADQLQQVIDISLSREGAGGATAEAVTTGGNQPPVTVTFVGTCTNRVDVVVRPSIYVFYRASNSNLPYQYLGYIDKGMITTTKLALGGNYQFMFVYDGKSYATLQQITQASYVENIDMGTICNNY